ncbi:hypothetical protein HK104_003926 [Borealophlyctis nickersoniae]|nr:hypothetical protein HK104_003926 [Borealophlyctis nickersoniae]
MNTYVPSGLHIRTSRQIASKIRELGFNCVRLNWSLEMFYNNPIIRPEVLAGMQGVFPDTSNVRALTVFDKVIEDLAAEKIGVIIDNHVSDAKWCCDPRDGNSLWFNDRYTVNDFSNAWEHMAARYASQRYVIGVDLRNEIRPDIRFEAGKLGIKFPGWGTGDRRVSVADFVSLLEFEVNPRGWAEKLAFEAVKRVLSLAKLPFLEYFDWKPVAEDVGSKITSLNPNVLILIQGIFSTHSYTPSILPFLLHHIHAIPQLSFIPLPSSFTSYAQVQNLTGVVTNPAVVRGGENRVGYTAHVYPFFYGDSGNKWDGAKPTYDAFKTEVDKYWGDVSNIANRPLWVGELGTGHGDISGAWNDYIIRYMQEKDFDFAYWPLADARPEVDGSGVFQPGSDGYGVMDGNYNGPADAKHYETVKGLMQMRINA